MNEKEERKLNLLAEIASLYYEQDLTQAQIAEKVFVSRSRISRLLKKAKQEGLVDIQINFVGERSYEHEACLVSKYGLKDARVYNNRNKTEEQTLFGIGQFAADYLKDSVAEATRLGISWGKTVYQTIEVLSVKEKKPIDIVQIIGSLSTTNKYYDSRECVRLAAMKFGGRAHFLNVPVYIENDYVRQTILEDPFVSSTLSLAHTADIIFTGIDSMVPENFMRLYNGYLDNKSFEEIKKRESKGFICAHFFNSEGVILDEDINKRIIGMDMSYLKKVKTVIGAAGGQGKVEAIKAVLKGKLINVLITDFKTANRILLED